MVRRPSQERSRSIATPRLTQIVALYRARRVPSTGCVSPSRSRAGRKTSEEGLAPFGNDALRGQTRRIVQLRKNGSSRYFSPARSLGYCRMSSRGEKDIRYEMVTLDRTIEQEIPSADDRPSVPLKATCWNAPGRDRFSGQK